MDRKLLSDWLKHPVSLELVDLLKEHRTALEEALLNSQFEANTLGRVNQVKGQINALIEISDLETFLLERFTKEEIDDGKDV